MALNAYAFGKMSTIAGFAAIAAYIASILMLLLAARGFRHLRRTPGDAEVLPGLGAKSPAPAENI